MSSRQMLMIVDVVDRLGVILMILRDSTNIGDINTIIGKGELYKLQKSEVKRIMEFKEREEI